MPATAAAACISTHRAQPPPSRQRHNVDVQSADARVWHEPNRKSERQHLNHMLSDVLFQNMSSVTFDIDRVSEYNNTNQSWLADVTLCILFHSQTFSHSFRCACVRSVCELVCVCTISKCFSGGGVEARVLMVTTTRLDARRHRATPSPQKLSHSKSDSILQVFSCTHRKKTTLFA